MDKPGDFFVGVTDLFSVLLPGAVLTFLAMRAEQSLHPVDLLGLLRLQDTSGYTAFVVLSFLFGHLVDLIGASVLDGVYDLLYADFRRYRGGFRSWLKGTPGRLSRRARGWYWLHVLDRDPTTLHIESLEGEKPKIEDPVYDVARSLAGQKPAGDKLYQWCRDWLQLYSPQAVREPDRLQANSKFFRSLVVVNTSFVALFWLVPRFRETYSGSVIRDLLWMASCLLVTVFAFLRYSDLRWKAVHHVYRLYVIGRVGESSTVSLTNPRQGTERRIETGSGSD